MARASGSRPTSARDSLTADSLSSIPATRARSPWPRRTAAFGLPSTARSTTTASCGRSCKRRATLPHQLRHRGPAAPLRRTRRGDGPRAARHVRLRPFGTRRREPCSSRGTRSASNRCTTRTTAETFRFASQVKALVRAAIGSRPSPPANCRISCGGFVPELFTPVQRDPIAPCRGDSAHLPCRLASRDSRLLRYLATNFAEPKPENRAGDQAERNDALQEAVADSCGITWSRMSRSDVFLSAGTRFDHRGGRRCQRKAGDPPDAVTLGFSEFEGTRNDETPIGSERCRSDSASGTRRIGHLAARFRVGPSGRFWNAMDQPRIYGVNTYFVSRAKPASGHEGGPLRSWRRRVARRYPSFRQIPKLVARALRALLGGLARVEPNVTRQLLALAQEWCLLTSPKSRVAGIWRAAYGGAYLLAAGPVTCRGNSTGSFCLPRYGQRAVLTQLAN